MAETSPNVEYDATVSSDYIYLGDSITCKVYLFMRIVANKTHSTIYLNDKFDEH
jgi:hypothetical protein